MLRLRFITILCTVASFASVASGRPSNASLVGTWLEPVFDATVRVTYRADRTFVASGYFLGEKTPSALGAGQWRVERDQLITRFKGKEVRRRIVSITRTEMRLEESPGKIFSYKRTD